jgi:hypothetical protein
MRVCDVLELPVVGATAGGVDETAGDARDEELVGDGELDDRVERLFARSEHRVEFFGLRDRAREAVEHKAVPCPTQNQNQTVEN